MWKVANLAHYLWGLKTERGELEAFGFDPITLFLGTHPES
jgi:hypothetical protein